jgi:DNA-binding MarR family transcriptional regulator
MLTGCSSDDKPLSLRLFRQFHMVLHALRHGIRPVFEGHDLTGPQWRVLHMLSEAGPEGLTPGQLSDRLMHTHGNTTGIVDKLEELGLARRAPHPEDRRALLIQLTEQGQALQAEVGPAFVARLEELVGCLSPAEQARLAGLLTRIAEHVWATLGEAPPGAEHPGPCRRTERNP